MVPRGWMTTLLVAAAVALTVSRPAAAIDTPTPAPVVTPSPPSSPPLSLPLGSIGVPRPPPRPPATTINATACLAAYRASGDAAAYLCCIDVSLGYCAGQGLEFGPDGEVCTVDWKLSLPLGGRQCCFRALPPEGAANGDGGPPPRRPPVGPTGSYGAGVSPSLDVDCRAYGWCRRTERTRPAPPAEAGAPGWVTAEAVTRCGSWAPDVYRRCDVTLCRFHNEVGSAGGRVGRGLRLPPAADPGGVAFCGSKRNTRLGFGTPAKCCLRRSSYWARVRCCSTCKRRLVRGRSAFGCCWAGPRPSGNKGR